MSTLNKKYIEMVKSIASRARKRVRELTVSENMPAAHPQRENGEGGGAVGALFGVFRPISCDMTTYSKPSSHMISVDAALYMNFVECFAEHTWTKHTFSVTWCRPDASKYLPETVVCRHDG